jgi:hypothetical protein
MDTAPSPLSRGLAPWPWAPAGACPRESGGGCDALHRRIFTGGSEFAACADPTSPRSFSAASVITTIIGPWLWTSHGTWLLGDRTPGSSASLVRPRHQPAPAQSRHQALPASSRAPAGAGPLRGALRSSSCSGRTDQACDELFQPSPQVNAAWHGFPSIS